MTDEHLFTCGRPSLSACIIAIALALTAGHPVWAQKPRTLPEVDRAVAELQTNVDTLQKDAAIGDVSRQLAAVSQELAEVKRLVQERSAPAAPPEAWKALGDVGGLFVLAWVVVSIVREFSRRQEARFGALVKVHDNDIQAKVSEALKEQKKDLQALKSELGGTS